ncbi:hypothetical protein E4U58_006678 [Claviceps cyperi]|nr:hypothetical protein E4U58_006678 [Claviceps cyperi]
MLFHRYLALLFASAIPSSALRVRTETSAFGYKRSNVKKVTSVRSNNTTTECNSNTTSTPMDPSYLTNHTADEVIKKLNLSPNVQGGYFRQTFEDPDKVPGSNRSLSTFIYYLIKGGDGSSKWHRVGAREVWHYHAGAPLVLHQLRRLENGSLTIMINALGPDIFQEQSPQVVIPKWVWQRATSYGDWTLVGITVSPGLTENGF